MTTTKRSQAGNATDGDRWYSIFGHDVAARLGVDPSVGLSSQNAAELLESHGPNALLAEPAVPGWRLDVDAVFG